MKIIKIKNKINTKIVNDLFSYDKSITVEIKKTFIEMNKKLSVEVSIKITNKLFACLSEINFTSIAKLSRINNNLNNKLNKEVNAGFSKINTKLNSKLTTEIENFKAHDASYTSEMQRIFSIINNVTIRLDEIKRKFITINATIQV